MGQFRDTVKRLLGNPKIGTVKKGEELDGFLSKLDDACISKDSYEDFFEELPSRYL